MKFVYNIYVLIIILRSTWVVQNAADFTLDELTHLSRELSPIECMRLLEAIYLAIPTDKEHRVSRETLANKRACLNELRTWNQQFPVKTEPKGRVVMILHLNALSRADLANWVRKNRESLDPVSSDEENDQEDTKFAKNKIFKRDTNENRPDHHLHAQRIARRMKGEKISKRTNQRDNIHHPMIAAISGEATRNERQAPPDESQSAKWKHAVSNNSLFLMIALGIVVIFICGMVFLIFRKLLRNSLCNAERSYLCPGNNTMHEKGLQCIGCLNDHDDFEMQSNMHCQISEIDIEGGSCINSVGIDSRRSYSDTVLCDAVITPRISIEKLELSDDESVVKVPRETQPLISCGCRTSEKKICGPKSKRKKKKTKACKSKGETKTCTKSYLKAMQDKILPRQRCKIKKDCTFDMQQFQDKILTLLNQECGVCQCCNCTPHWKIDGSKMKNRSSRREEKCVKPEKKECKRKKKPKRDGCENLSITKGCNKEVLMYQASVTSGSPMSDRRSSRKQESDSAKKPKVKTEEKSKKLGSPRRKRVAENRVLLSSSSSSDTDESQNGNNDDEKQSKSRSKRTKQLDASVNTLLSAHDKPKRFF